MDVLTSYFYNGVAFPVLFACASCILVVLYYLGNRWTGTDMDLPWVALDEKGQRDADTARMQFMTNCRELLEKGLKTVRGPFRVYSGDGPRIVLPMSFADEIRNDEKLSFGPTAVEGVFHTYPGFQPFGMAILQGVIQDMIRLKLTRSLDAVTPELTDEATESLNSLFGNSEEWQESKLKPLIYRLIARLSSRVFFGPEVCNNEEWLDIAVSYTQDSFGAHRVLRTWNPLLRPIVHWFIPECRRVRAGREATQRIAAPIVKAHLEARAANGGKSGKTSSVIGWIQDVARDKQTTVPMEDAQLFLAVAAIHTTTECLTYVMADLMSHPDAIPRLREEMSGVLKDMGWQKTSFSQMKLLDSVLKESQGLHPVSSIMMERKVLSPVTLSTGVTLPKSSHLFLTTEGHYSPEFYPSPDKFIPDRFLQIRESGDVKASSKSHFVTTSPEHLGFGHGRNSCPGRFFASNELKIALVHLLLKYDWKYSPEGRLPDQTAGQSTWLPMDQKVMYRKRQVEPGLKF